MDFMLYKLNILQTINVASMLNPPPTMHEMNIGKNLKHMFATKCPRRLAGKTIAKYFNVVLIKLNLKSGTAFFINLKLSNDIIVNMTAVHCGFYCGGLIFLHPDYSVDLMVVLSDEW